MKKSLKIKKVQILSRREQNGIVLALAACLCVLILWSFTWGRFDVPVLQVVRIVADRFLDGFTEFAAFFHMPFAASLDQTWTDQMATAVMNIRLPRILLACLVGGCLSAAGTAYQSVFQNPMASPDILGASSGACFGAALAILFDFSQSMIVLTAFAVSLSTVWLVHLISRHTRGSKTMNTLLAGIMISSLFSAGTSYVKLVADPTDQLPEITYWMMGSLSGVRMNEIKFVIWPMLFGIIPLLLLRWRINLLTLGQEEAYAMGVHTERLRMTVILCATVLTAACVSVSGMIGWVGLVIPHLSRKLVGNDCRYLLPVSMLFGAGFLLLVDDLSRNLIATEIPVGILTAFVGAPFFIYLMIKRDHA